MRGEGGGEEGGGGVTGCFFGRLGMIVEGGRFVEYGVFIQETATDWSLTTRRGHLVLLSHSVVKLFYLFFSSQS